MYLNILMAVLMLADPCKSIELNQGQPAPCSGILIDHKAAENVFNIVENDYPKSLKKIKLMEDELEIDKTLVTALKAEIIELKKDNRELTDFAKKSMLDYDKAQKTQSIIIAVTAIGSVAAAVLIFVTVGYATRGFAGAKN